MRKRGIITIVLLCVCVILGGGLFLFRHLFHKEVDITAKDLTVYLGETPDFDQNVELSDGSHDYKIIGDYDTSIENQYSLTATTENGEKEVKFNLTVKNRDESQNPYLIKISRNNNYVMVYALDSNNEYSILVRHFVCSTGTDTPVGTFNTSDKYEWRALYGGVYGQYATRINGPILFHSVPYTAMSKNSLEWEEYNKLGTAASMGCIRLEVENVKWIYDNCPVGTTVTLYDGDIDSSIKELDSFQTIDASSPNKGWDPTDPDPANPWNE